MWTSNIEGEANFLDETLKNEHEHWRSYKFFWWGHGEHWTTKMNISSDEIMVNISGLVQSPPTALPVPTTNQQVEKKPQIKTISSVTHGYVKELLTEITNLMCNWNFQMTEAVTNVSLQFWDSIDFSQVFPIILWTDAGYETQRVEKLSIRSCSDFSLDRFSANLIASIGHLFNTYFSR